MDGPNSLKQILPTLFIAPNVCEMLAGHAAAGVHGQVYVHREGLSLSLLREGLERLRYDEVVKEVQREHR